MSRREGAAPTFLKALIVRFRFLLAFIAIGFLVASWDRILSLPDGWFRSAKLVDPSTEGFEWYCPMHPSLSRKEPANCPSCGMPLSRRRHGKDTGLPAGILSRVELSPYRIEQAGLATSEVLYRPLVREISAAGTVAYDDRKITQVSARMAGRVDAIYVPFKGTRVRAGDPLYQIFSSGPVTTQEEFLQLLRTYEQTVAQAVPDREAQARAARAVEAAKQRLRLWGIPESQIAELEKSRNVQTQVTVNSPATGVVFKKDILLGHQVQAGEVPYTIADDSEVWVEAEVFERDIGLIRLGQAVEARSDSFADLRFFGTVLTIDPELDAATRTIKVCLGVDNKEGRLRPGMYVTAIIRVSMGKITELQETEEPARKQEADSASIVDHEVYVCKMHKDLVFDKPGKCERCGGMELEKLKIPAGSMLVFACPHHPEIKEEKPGTCSRDGKPLELKVVSQPVRSVVEWMCPVHPAHTAPEKGKCPDSGKEMRLVRREDSLAVPFSAIVDTGARKTVFLEKGEGVFEAVQVLLGPRAGSYYPVLAGLKEGDRVVTAGAFLLDAEASLNPGAAAAYFGATGHAISR